MDKSQVENIQLKKITAGISTDKNDLVAVEEPLELIIAYSSTGGRLQKNISVTMRTPGNDEELAAGFLFTEGIIQSPGAIEEIKHLIADKNRLLIKLKENVMPVLHKADRNFYTTSGCGICGKTSIDAIRNVSLYQNEKDSVCISAKSLYGLQKLLRKQQEVFEYTGGIHASALFSSEGNFIMSREDIGRHNALDKIIGSAVLKNALPLNDSILLLSGRASFELIQKAVMAGIKIVAAVGAPSSLAIELAVEAGITLAGFLRDESFNLYSGFRRVQL